MLCFGVLTESSRYWRSLMSTREKISRRTWLKGMALLPAAGIQLVLTSAAAEAKASKASVHYRDSPKEMRMCHMCKFYIAGGGQSGMGCMGGMGMMGVGACQVVEGRISPMGYCGLYIPL
jgi:hypothetical protein